MAEVTITPGHAGPVSAKISVLTGDFGPLDAKEVTLALSDPAAGVEPIKRPATKSADGTWRVDGLTVPVPGHWDVDVAILLSEFELVHLRDAVDIR
jgi:copper transport protein